MNALLKYTLFISQFWFIVFTGYSQQIQNQRFEQSGRQINITYDLLSDPGSPGPYSVEVFLSTDGGRSFKGPLQKLTGAAGENITAGSGKRIVWDVLSEMEKLEGDVVFELRVKPHIEGQFTDPRDGRIYKTIQIGSQVWMAENLAWLPTVSRLSADSETSPFFYVHGYDGTSVSSAKATTNYRTYGVLYNWPAAVQACPAGWHLPADTEWTTLENFLIVYGYNYDGSTTDNKIAKSLASSSGWNSFSKVGTIGNTDYPGKRNVSGFSALPGGYRFVNGSFFPAGYYGFWWSATEDSSSYAWIRMLDYGDSALARHNYDKVYGFSVRCLRD